MNISHLILLFISLGIFSCGKGEQGKNFIGPGVKKSKINERNAHSNNSREDYQKIISLAYKTGEGSENQFNLSNNGIDLFLEDPWMEYYDLASGQEDLGCATLNLVDNAFNKRSAYIQIEV